MKHTVIRVARKSLLSRSGPTRLMRVLSSTKMGRYVIRELFFYYLKHSKGESYSSMKAMSYRDIQEYHIKQTLVDRLRKAGL